MQWTLQACLTSALQARPSSLSHGSDLVLNPVLAWMFHQPLAWMVWSSWSVQCGVENLSWGFTSRHSSTNSLRAGSATGSSTCTRQRILTSVAQQAMISHSTSSSISCCKYCSSTQTCTVRSCIASMRTAFTGSF